MNRSIGIFDSGFGGLDILRGIAQGLPEYDLIYLGDTARVPYGERSKKEIYGFCCEAINFLFGKNCQLIIFACNTASSGALRKIQREYLPEKYPKRKVLGVLIPAAETAVKKTKNKRVGVIGTRRTVRSGAFRRELLKKDPKIEVFQKACPLLVGAVERGEENSKKTEKALKKYLESLISSRVDTLILGCTHYGILENQTRKILGRKIKIVNQSKIIAGKLGDYLKRHPEIEERLSRAQKKRFFVTGEKKRFEILGSRFFGEKIRATRIRLA